MIWEFLKHHKREIPIGEVFSEYVRDNIALLTGIGVIASVTALFLNIDADRYSELKSLQLFLLLFLSLALVYALLNTLTWLIHKADSVFSSIVIVTLTMLLFQLLRFVMANFGEELKKYLIFIYLSVLYLIWNQLKTIQRRLEKTIEGVDDKYRPFLTGLLVFAFFYLWFVLTDLYHDFSHNLALNWQVLIKPFYNIILVSFTCWYFVVEIALAYGKNMKRHPYLWGAFLFSPILAFLLYASIEGFYLIKTLTG